MHALVAVHGLRHPQVADQRAQHVGLVARQVGAAADVLHHLPHRLLGGVVQVLVEADGHQVRGRLGEREIDLQVLADGEAEGAGQAGFQRRDAHLAVALHAVAVARHEQRALVEHGQVQRRAGFQFLVVHVAAEGARHRGAAAAPRLGRRHADDAEERVERQLRAPGQRADAAFAVDGGMDGLVVRELLRQRAEQRQDGDEAPVHRGLGVEDIDLQRVAGLRAAHIDRPGDEVRAGAFRQGLQRRQVVRGHARHLGQAGHAAGRERVELHGVAGLDLQHRRAGRVEVAEDHLVRRGRDLVMLRHGGSFVELRLTSGACPAQRRPACHRDAASNTAWLQAPAGFLVMTGSPPLAISSSTVRS